MAVWALCVSLQEVERKHEAMLQMYGEKAEEAEELKLDIDDLKTMYRQQVRTVIILHAPSNCDYNFLRNC